MKKSILLLSLLSSLTFADDNTPHITPALVCPPGEICCPVSVTCSFLNGCGSSGNWQVNGSVINYLGVKTFAFNSALLSQYSTKTESYSFAECTYIIGPIGRINLTLTNSNKNLKTQGGEWQFSFEKTTATCQNNNSSLCEFYDGYDK